jgi:hypothetical protein
LQLRHCLRRTKTGRRHLQTKAAAPRLRSRKLKAAPLVADSIINDPRINDPLMNDVPWIPSVAVPAQPIAA